MTQARALAEAIRSVCGCIAIEELLDVLCREAVAVTASRAALASFTPRDPRHGAARFVASAGWGEARGPSAAVRSALFGLLRRVASERAAVRFSAGARRRECVLTGLSALPEGPILAIPVFASAGHVEVLLVVAGGGSRFSPHDSRALDELALSASQALRNAVVLDRARADQQRLQMFAAAGANRDVMWSWDILGQRVWWSSEIFGCPVVARDQPIAWKLAGLHPDDVARVGAGLQDALRSDTEIWTDTYRVRHKDRSWVLVEDHGYFIRDREGSAINCFGLMRDITDRTEYRQLSRLNEELAHRALHDPLTGLPNRVLLMDRLERAMKCAARRPDSVAVCMVDVDHFKSINDELGHAAGDAILVALAARLAGVVRGADTIARLGGDEFVVVLSEIASAGQAAASVARMLRAMESPIRVGGSEVVVTISIGVVLADGAKDDCERLLADADAALYHTKRRGRARYDFFDREMRACATKRLETENALRGALNSGELHLVYQPEVDLASRRIVGLEALLRWEHPKRGLLMPSDFIALAEDTGLIVPIGLWIIRQACATTALRADDPALADLVIWVNLSSRELTQPDLVDYLAHTLAETQAEPSQLGIEITESTLVNPDVAQPVLTALSQLGVQVAIDDFGTGFSSLSYLRQLPVSVLKIDRSFVAELGHEHESEETAIVRAIITLAHSLKMAAVAEGVETSAQAATLDALGCDLAQGFHFGRPGTLGSLDSVPAAWTAAGGET